MASCAAPWLGAREGRPARIPPAQLALLVARVEAIRGQRFARAPEAWRLPQAQLRALLERELDRTLSRAQLARDAELAASLGLIPRGFDLRAAVLGFQEANAAGFYSPRAHRLYLVDAVTSATPQEEDDLVVHELTHALQAQHVAYFAALPRLRGDDDLAFALTAWLEGEATYVELASGARERRARLSPAAFAARFPTAAAFPELPRAVAAPLLAAYPLGYALVDAVVARGGARALDSAQVSPPLSSEELLHPERYLAAQREPLASLSRDPQLPGCRTRATNCYGELGLRSWLEASGALGSAAAAAAEGWDADRAWRFDCGGRAASAWLLAFETPREASELEAELTLRAPRAGDDALAVTRSGPRVLVSHGLADPQRAALLALPAPREFRELSAYLAARR